MTSEGRSRPTILARSTRAAAPGGPSAGRGCADYGLPLLWFAGLAAAALSIAAFVLWARNGAGILLDMILALCL
jgi:hypothetical protein